MAAPSPVAIGTRGTVGSLVRREIEYFTKVELDRCVSSSKSEIDMGSSSGRSRPSFWSLRMNWKRKKRRGSSNGFLPSICSAVEVADTNGISGFSYRILKNDMKEMIV
ncbi:hypothetical protein JCGZ_21244 [Jatropha curcas]|uniref:Uncharacterized protein n=1 Tax=Jatropha curcas TaxID=180498 RepID=A0A067JDG0_JATCU|nr:uncharacterized protein LOC119371092 [Jatropha curcas]KDP20773.1 hypothetical protein JCGZ_21244 [Jatropha curcas]